MSMKLIVSWISSSFQGSQSGTGPGTESITCFGIAARMNFGTIFNLVESAPIEQVLRRKLLRGRSESGIDRHGPAVTANAYPASHTLHTHSIDSIHRMAMLKVLSQCLWKITKTMQTLTSLAPPT